MEFLKDKNKKKQFLCSYGVFVVNGMLALSIGSLLPFIRDAKGLEYAFCGMIVSLHSVGNLISSFAGGALPAFIGRKKSILLFNSFFAIAYLMIILGNSNWLIAAALLSAAMVASLTACGLQAPEQPAEAPAAEAEAEAPAVEAEAPAVEPAADAITLVYAEVNPLDTIVGQTGTKFKETVEEMSNGSIIIDIQASGVLGAENDVLDTMLGGGGTIDMSRISAFALTSYGGQKSMLLSLPYTFVSREHFWNFADSDLAQEFLLEPAENGTGVRGLFYGEEGFRHFFTVNPVNSIEDLSGLKLRVSNDPVMNGLCEGLGASPTVVSFGELYSALQTGVVDGAEQPIANYKSNAFPEVANNLILDGHTLGAIQVIITDEAWNSLTEEQQNILVEAGKVASAYNREISADFRFTVINIT